MKRNKSKRKNFRKSLSDCFLENEKKKKDNIKNLIEKIFEYKKNNLKQGKQLIFNSKEKNRKENLILSLRNEKKYLQNLNEQLNIYLKIIKSKKINNYSNYINIKSYYNDKKITVEEIEKIMNEYKTKLNLLQTNKKEIFDEYEKKLKEKKNKKKDFENQMKNINNDIELQKKKKIELKKTKSDLYKKMEENTNNFDDEKTLVLKIKELEDLCENLSINNQNSRNISLTHLILNSENFEIKLKELEIKNQILKNYYKKLKEKIDNKLTEEKNIKTLIQLKKNSNFKQYFELLEKLDMKSNQTKKTQSSQSMTQITNNFSYNW